MAWELETVSSTPAFLREGERLDPILESLDYFQMDVCEAPSAEPSFPSQLAIVRTSASPRLRPNVLP